MSADTETRQIAPAEETVASTNSGGRQWMRSVGRFIGGTAGVVFIVLGAVALMRSGLPTTMEGFTTTHVNAGWLDHTPLLAMIHLFVGASLASAVGYLAFGERAMVAGIVMLVLGIIVWIEPSALHDSLGIHRVHGLTYGLAGGAMMASGSLISRGTRVVRRTIRV